MDLSWFIGLLGLEYRVEGSESFRAFQFLGAEGY